ncbi:unnamed protein product [Paramecium sonneborni]|uniref:Transmembrane protein n=1 Tax=Paramecium sonneborni TaxID=65129 RepID=A0A8S1PXG5_9CILI|nr:unnamed protein product [Paramecium sonneborni]
MFKLIKKTHQVFALVFKYQTQILFFSELIFSQEVQYKGKIFLKMLKKIRKEQSKVIQINEAVVQQTVGIAGILFLIYLTILHQIYAIQIYVSSFKPIPKFLYNQFQIYQRLMKLLLNSMAEHFYSQVKNRNNSNKQMFHLQLYIQNLQDQIKI